MKRDDEQLNLELIIHEQLDALYVKAIEKLEKK
jgi:hypothetical protein